MKERIKTICLILITIAILFGIGFFSWMNYQKLRIEQCKGVCGDNRSCMEDCTNLYRFDFRK